MLIYIIVFLLSIMMFFIAENSHSKRTRVFFILLGILIPSILAGCRDSSVGTDVKVYGINNYRNAYYASSFLGYFNRYMSSSLSEPLYHLCVYIVSRFSDNYHLGLFFYELITISFTYVGMSRCKKKFGTSICFGMFLYYLAMYNVSLNIMRQSIAVSVVFLAATYLFEEKYKYYFFWMIIAIGFHTSAILGFVILAMYIILRQGRNVAIRKQFTQMCVFILLVTAILAVGSKGIEFLVANGIIRSNYMKHLASGAYASNNISVVSVSMYMGFLILYMMHYKNLSKQKLESLFFAMVSGVMVLSMFGQLISTYMFRAAYYFMPLQAVGLASTMKCYTTKGNRRICIAMISIYALMVWYIIFVIRGNNATVPYIFNISND